MPIASVRNSPLHRAGVWTSVINEFTRITNAIGIAIALRRIRD